jgi:hypothetical protein
MATSRSVENEGREGDRSRVLLSPEEIPTYRLVPVLGPEGELAEGYRGVQPIGSRRILAVVSSRYGLVQHRTLAASLVRLSETLEAPAASGLHRSYPRLSFHLYAGGRRMEARLVIGRKFRLGGEEEFYPGVRVMNSLDGSWAVRVEAFALRIACTNQLYAGLSESVLDLRALHRGGERDLEVELELALTRVLGRFDQVLDLYKGAMERSIPTVEVAPSLQREGMPARHVSLIARRLPEHFGLLLWGEVSCWEAYQCVTDYLSHEVEVNPERARMLERVAARTLLLPSRSDSEGSLPGVALPQTA